MKRNYENNFRILNRIGNHLKIQIFIAAGPSSKAKVLIYVTKNPHALAMETKKPSKMFPFIIKRVLAIKSRRV